MDKLNKEENNNREVKLLNSEDVGSLDTRTRGTLGDPAMGSGVGVVGSTIREQNRRKGRFGDRVSGGGDDNAGVQLAGGERSGGSVLASSVVGKGGAGAVGGSSDAGGVGAGAGGVDLVGVGGAGKGSGVGSGEGAGKYGKRFKGYLKGEEVGNSVNEVGVDVGSLKRNELGVSVGGGWRSGIRGLDKIGVRAGSDGIGDYGLYSVGGNGRGVQGVEELGDSVKGESGDDVGGADVKGGDSVKGSGGVVADVEGVKGGEKGAGGDVLGGGSAVERFLREYGSGSKYGAEEEEKRRRREERGRLLVSVVDGLRALSNLGTTVAGGMHAYKGGSLEGYDRRVNAMRALRDKDRERWLQGMARAKAEDRAEQDAKDRANHRSLLWRLREQEAKGKEERARAKEEREGELLRLKQEELGAKRSRWDKEDKLKAAKGKAEVGLLHARAGTERAKQGYYSRKGSNSGGGGGTKREWQMEVNVGGLAPEYVKIDKDRYNSLNVGRVARILGMTRVNDENGGGISYKWRAGGKERSYSSDEVMQEAGRYLEQTRDNRDAKRYALEDAIRAMSSVYDKVEEGDTFKVEVKDEDL